MINNNNPERDRGVFITTNSYGVLHVQHGT
jgi:hypothetical protein